MTDDDRNEIHISITTASGHRYEDLIVQNVRRVEGFDYADLTLPRDPTGRSEDADPA